MSSQINIVVVDDHALFREGIRFVLSQIEGFSVIGEASNGVEFLDLLRTVDPDIVLLDISMPEMDGIVAAELALQKYPKLKIITLSSYGQEAYYYKMIKAGVLGFVQKKADKSELEDAIRQVYKGENYFPQDILRKLIVKVGSEGENSLVTSEIFISKREKEVLLLICQGYSNTEIANELFISPKTVDNHRTNLLSKTNTRNAPNLVMFAIKNKLIEL